MTPAPSLQELIDTVRADTPGNDPIDRLAQASRTVSELEDVADALLGHFVDQCRRRGRSWSEISAALGVSKQAAHKRFSTMAAPAFDRFTPRARAVLGGAAAEARSLGCGHVGTEHLLLALFEPPESVAAQMLAGAGISRSACEERVRSRTEKSSPGPKGELPYTPSAMEVLRGSVEEALRLGHNYVGTEHLLLALFRDPDDPVAETLAAVGAGYDDMKQRLTEAIARLTRP
jgi:ATP-dependent Clp protease ATP-binding subunit ClpA